MRGVNRVILVGSLGRDPEIKNSGKVKIARLSIATNTSVKDDKGQWQERAEWHTVILWDQLADIAGQFLKKGSRVFIEGRLQTSSWEDKKTGEKKYRTEVIARELVLLGDAHRASSSDGDQVLAQNEDSIGVSGNESPF